MLGTRPSFTPWTPQRGWRGPRHPSQGWWGRVEGQAELASPTTPVAKLHISVESPSETYLRNVLNNTCWWERKVLTNPGKKNRALLQMGDESSTDHNKGARFITAAAAEPPRKLQGTLKQPWKGFKQQFAPSMATVESRPQGKKVRGKQSSCPSSCRCQTSWSLMDVEIGQRRTRGRR